MYLGSFQDAGQEAPQKGSEFRDGRMTITCKPLTNIEELVLNRIQRAILATA